jgi:hypothetical protein
MHVRVIAAVAIASLLASCTNPFGGGTLCTASVEPAIVVEIRDARTGAAIAAGAYGAVRDDEYLDSLRPYASHGPTNASLYSRRAADERVGVYAVEVRHAGYRPWTAVPVRVTRDECHVRTQTLRAALVPEG